MPSCCVPGCTSSSASIRGVSFYRIPKIDQRSPKYLEISTKRQMGWLAAINQTDFNVCKNFGVCGLHFDSGLKAKLTDVDNPNWLPHLYLNESADLHYVENVDGIPYFEGELIEHLDGPDVGVIASPDESDFFGVVDVDVDVAKIDFDKVTEAHRTVTSQTNVSITKLSSDVLQKYEEKIRLLEEKLSRYEAKIENFDGDDDKTCFFTGLSNFTTMKELFLSLEEFLPECRLLTKFQIFSIVLWRMRLNLSFRFLAYQFGVSPQTISKYFHEGLFVMYSKLRSLVYFPSREDIKKTMPLSFQERFGNEITTIMDCLEIFIERSSLPKAQAQTWSTYKHHNTLKYLIAITPQGMICFISEGYGGRASDKFITEDCGFLDNLQAGDVVMADRGFLIDDSLKHLGVRSEIPSFTKGKDQLHPFELEHTRKIANLRIEVEQVIGLLRKKYTIFSQNNFPISAVSKLSNKCGVSVVDQMIAVCSALVNLCSPICVKGNDV